MTRSDGFTLIELMITMSMLTVVMMALYNINSTMTKAAMQQESLTTIRDEGREALRVVTRFVRMAQAGTIMAEDGEGTLAPIGTSPVQSIQFQFVADVDDTGTTIREDFTVGLSPMIEFTPDFDDANQDGFTTTQLVQLDENGGFVKLLTTHLNPVGGFVCVRTAGGLQFTLMMFDDGNGTRPPTVKRLDQVVAARN